jgi:hypothetical protein
MAVKPDMTEELRTMVREVLREVVPQRGGFTATAVESVQIGNDHDLAILLARVTEPGTAEKIRAGKLRFTLSGAATAAAPAAPLTGVITEQKLDRLIKGGTLVLGPDAVLTPLARDRARRLGLKIERRR